MNTPIHEIVSQYMSELGKKGHQGRLTKYGKDYYKKIALIRWAKHRQQKTTERS